MRHHYYYMVIQMEHATGIVYSKIHHHIHHIISALDPCTYTLFRQDLYIARG
jgi:hypothetical protein